ncbi:hypothetical protein DJ021_12760 [Phenylobacterium hankyongense]|uniref:DUF7662 domain-containing protein n=1 Tax=Phenylobacterium hankyongense TaxID=1813876 RepID=A0A328B265_9CAUL|nr:hypothetical protein [Phenylobacterium hankyongense]RAK60615.1 hypothetical protein DJ021_12760 [Phenylobacterium hankyongense]
MSKYQPLSDRLTGHPEDEWRASFAELEEVLGFPLPKGARSGRAWWANDLAKAHSRAWAAHGWAVGDIDHAAERVVFRRGAASGQALQKAAGLEPLQDRAGSTGVQPAVTKVVSKATPQPAAINHRALRIAALVAGGAAVVAGVAALVVRGLMAPKIAPPRPPIRKLPWQR